MRAAHDLSLQQVAQRAGCSAGYVHKLELDRVRTPSPRVPAGLAEALGLAYDELMKAAGYESRSPTQADNADPALEALQVLSRLRVLTGPRIGSSPDNHGICFASTLGSA